MPLRNLNASRGLCNGTRLVVRNISKNVLDCEILTGNKVGRRVFIPKINLEPSDTGYNFTFRRLQFPVKLSYSMTIHKSQGQSLVYVGIYLKSDVFTHGQLYTALSRVQNKENLKIEVGGVTRIRNEKVLVRNVVYPELLN